MKAITVNGTIKVFSTIPSQWNGTFNYQNADPSVHYADGFRDLVRPEYNPLTSKLGDIYFDAANDNFTYQLIPLTDEELKSRLINQSRMNKESIIQESLQKQVIESFQAIEDDAALLANQAVFPFWEPDIAIEVNKKYQAFDGTDLKLYRVVQSHTTQLGWEPPITPALFSRVAMPGEILAWVQPTGAQDAYQIGDQVTHNGSTWESTAADNVWEPGVFGWVVV